MQTTWRTFNGAALALQNKIKTSHRRRFLSLRVHTCVFGVSQGGKLSAARGFLSSLAALPVMTERRMQNAFI